MTEPDELSDEKRAWLGSVYTRTVVRDLQHSLDQALSYLIAQAAVSNDPIVRAATSTYNERKNLMRIFEMPKD